MLTLAEVFVGMFFLANVLFCAAYVVREMMYLRAITIVAAVCTFPYFYFQEQPLWSAMFWQGAFVVINTFNLFQLIMARRPVQLSELEEKLHLLVFNVMNPREMLELLHAGEWRDLQAGDRLVERGQFMNGMYVLAEGEAGVIVADEQKARLREGDFIGEMSFITGQSASADVAATSATKSIYWNRNELEALYNRKPHLRDIVQAILGRNMAEKLRRTHDGNAL